MLGIFLTVNLKAVVQVVVKCRQAASIVQHIIDHFAEKPDVYKQATGKRKATQLWSEGSLASLQLLV